MSIAQLLSEKKNLIKVLLALLLILILSHLAISYFQKPPKPKTGASARLTIGVQEKTLNAYVPFDDAIDSLLVREFEVSPGSIRSERIQLENLNYIRKNISIPKNFPNTLLILDMNQLAEARGWDIYNVSEKLNRQASASDFLVEIGHQGFIYCRMEFSVNSKLRPMGKEVYIVVKGFGKNYGELAKSFLSLSENFAFLVPKTEPDFTIMTFEAKRTGKSVIKQIPWSKNIYTFDEKMTVPLITEQFYEDLSNCVSRSFITCTASQESYQVLKKELPRLAKKGYIARVFTERW